MGSQILEGAYFSFRTSAQIGLLSDMEGLQLLVSPEEERGPGNTGCSQKIAVTGPQDSADPRLFKLTVVGESPCGVYGKSPTVGSLHRPLEL